MISKCYKCESWHLCCIIQDGLCTTCKRIDEKNKFEFKTKMRNDDLNNLEAFLRKNPDKIYHFLAWSAIHTNVDSNYSY
jgi:hypothetical protein